MDEYGLVLMLMAFGILCGLSGYAFGYADRDKQELLGTFDEKAYDQAYDEWYETNNAYPNDTVQPYKGWGDELS